MMKLEQVRRSLQERGIVPTLGSLAYRAARRVTDVRVLAAMSLKSGTLDASFGSAEPELGWGFLSAETLHRALGRTSDCDMDAAFIDGAIARGDRCFGAIDGEVLATYGWYATQPTEVTEGLELRFGDAWAYMYKGYTPHAYRGRRLHGVGMARAMAAFVAEGYEGLVSYVDANNAASLKSCARLGYHTFGTLMAAQIGASWVVHATRGCRPYGLRLAAVRPRRARATNRPASSERSNERANERANERSNERASERANDRSSQAAS